MNKQYFVLEFAHAMPEHCKRIRVSFKTAGYVLGAIALLVVVSFGLFSSYLRMSWKVSQYNELRTDFDHLRKRYQELQGISRQHREQIASLETLATEVSVAYGLNAPADSGGSETLATDFLPHPTVGESLKEYNFLKTASFGGIYQRYAFKWQAHSQPSIWPMEGVLRSSFGGRSDPFTGEGAFHTGIDLSAPKGTPVRVTADGVVASFGWSGAYGKLLVVDHGNGLRTYYAHLSSSLVLPGQEVRRGQVVALSGATGRATGPHVHYEVRLAGTPVNPYKYLARSRPPRPRADTAKLSHNDLGL
jgi:murein DD-endopeptidase MepM/ murein hydrolase activator NlpD